MTDEGCGITASEVLKPTLETEYTLEQAALAAALGRSANEIEAYSPGELMARPDGSALIRVKIYPVAGERWEALVELSGGVMRYRDLAPVLTENPRGKFHDSNWASIAFPTGVLFVQGTAQAVFVPTAPGLPAEPFAVRNNICDQRINENVTAEFRPSRLARLVATGSQIAVPLYTGSEAEWCAVLQVDLDRKDVTWNRWLVDEAAPQVRPLLKRLLGKTAAPEPSPLSAEGLIQLTPDDYPHQRWNRSLPVISEALIRRDRLLISTMGDRGRNRPKYGYPCAAIAEIGPDGRVRTLPFLEDFTGFPDEKKRGITCRFASDGRHAILTPVYKTTDPWAGKQGLFDLETHELRLIQMPRGFAGFEIADFNGGRVWAGLGQDKTTMRIVALRVSAP